MRLNMNNNRLFDALLEWGKSHILSSQIDSRHNPYLKEIEVYCKPFIENNELENMLSCLVKKLDGQVNYAISVLSNKELILSSEDDSIWHEAEDAFYTFDMVNYLMDAVNFLVIPVRKEVAVKIMKRLDEIFSHITSWLDGENFSPMRLTILNDIRCERLSDIPEDERYLFPWYENYSEYRENVLEIVIENFHDYLSKKWNKISREIPEWQLIEIWHEFNRDSQLLTIISNEAVFHKKLLDAASIPSSLKLLGLTSDESLCAEYIIPGIVEDAGVIRVCISLLNDVISEPSDKITKLYWTFLLGFCGPCLDDKERLELLDSVEDMIDEIDISGAIGKEAKVLNNLKLWFRGKFEDSRLIEESFNRWFEMMKEKATNMPVAEFDEMPEILWNTIQRLREEEIEAPHDFMESIVVWCKRKWESTFKEESAFYGECALAASASSETPLVQRRELKLDNNPIQLSLKVSPKDEYIILSSLESERIQKCENREDYVKLWEYLEKSKNDYWGGCFITKDNTPEKSSAQEIKDRILTRKGSNYKKAIIGISSEKDLLNEFIQELHVMISEEKGQLKDTFIKKIIIIIISLE